MLYPILAWLLRTTAVGASLLAAVALLLDFSHVAPIASQLMILMIVPAGMITSSVGSGLEWCLRRPLLIPHANSLDGVRAALRGTVYWEALEKSLSDNGLSAADWPKSWRYIRKVIERAPSYGWVEFHKFSYCIYRDLLTSLFFIITTIIFTPRFSFDPLGGVMITLMLLAIWRMHQESSRHAREAVMVYLSEIQPRPSS